MKQANIPTKIQFVLFLIIGLAISGYGPKWTESEKEGYTIVQNKGGQTLGFSPQSGVTILIVDRFAFKDLNQNGGLDPYEDWRISADERTADLASKMAIERGMMKSTLWGVENMTEAERHYKVLMAGGDQSSRKRTNSWL